MIALIAICIVIFFPVILFGIYKISEKIKKARRGNMMTTMSVVQRAPAEEGSERLILDKKGASEKDPLDDN